MVKKGKFEPGFGYQVPSYVYQPTRKLHSKNQITDPSQIVRGKVVNYYSWYRVTGTSHRTKAVILSAPSAKGYFNVLLFGKWVGRKWKFDNLKFELSFEGVGIVPQIDHAGTRFNNLGYLVDTGRTMSETEIEEAIKKAN